MYVHISLVGVSAGPVWEACKGTVMCMCEVTVVVVLHIPIQGPLFVFQVCVYCP